jgi:orotidine-5'-phosphate decarboxylase
MTPKEAIDAGANQIVVGRPITQAADSYKATKSILAEINE